MQLFHAIAMVDHQSAKLFQFNEAEFIEREVHAHLHATAQHRSAVRAGHAFYGEVCDALDGIAEVLITGGHTALADFRHYVEKHRPLTAKHIVDYQVVDHPTDKQLLALAKKYFEKHDQTAGKRLPS